MTSQIGPFIAIWIGHAGCATSYRVSIHDTDALARALNQLFNCRHGGAQMQLCVGRRPARYTCSILTLVATCALLGTPAASAELLSKCSRVGTVSRNMICGGIDGYSFWVQQATPARSSSAIKSAVQSLAVRVAAVTPQPPSDRSTQVSELQRERQTLVDTKINAQALLDKFIKAQTEQQVIMNAANQKVGNLKVTTQTATDDFKSKTDAYKKLSAELQALEPEYQRALSRRYASVACAIGQMFGTGTQCATNYLQDVLDTQVTSRYHDKERAVNAALADMTASADTLKTLNRENGEQTIVAEVATARSDLMRQNLTRLTAKVADLDSSIKAADAAAQSLANLPAEEALFNSLIAQMKDALNIVRKSNAKALPTNFARLQVLFRAYAAASNHLSQSPTSGWTADTLPLDTPREWKPSGFFVASSYTDVSRDAGTDFAWAWSKGHCKAVEPCTVVLIAVNRDCPSATINLAYTDAGKTVEVKSTSAPVAVTTGEITVVEVPSKYSTAVTTGWMRGLECRS